MIGLIEFIYKGTLPSQEDVLKELIVYSEKILLERLRVHCEKTLTSRMTKENAIEMYEISQMSGSENLKEAALQVLIKDASYFADQLVSLSANKKLI